MKGAWCHGYHDGDEGCFLASAIALDPPLMYDMIMNRNSRWWTTAKWDHKPNEVNISWLTFKKKDKITNISFPYLDAWCWTGHYKGKWGLFPACFVENLREEPTLGKHTSGEANYKIRKFSFGGFSSPASQQVSKSSTTSTTSGSSSSGLSAFSARISELNRSSAASNYDKRADSDISKEHTQPDIGQGTLQKLLGGGCLEAVEDLLDKHFAKVAQGEYSWLDELVDIGYTTREMAELLFQKSNDAPWIYFEQQNIPSGTVTLGVHIPGCAHQGGHNLNFPPRLITTAPDEQSLELSGLTWPKKAENLKRIVAEFCGLAGIAPTTRDRNDWCGHVRFEDDNSTAFVTYGLLDAATMSFGYSVGDVLLVIELARKTYTNCLRAPREFCEAGQAVKSLYIVLKALEDEVNDPRSPLLRHEQRQNDFVDITASCLSVLAELDKIVVKYSSLGTNDVKLRHRLGFPNEEITQLRGKLGFYTSTLSSLLGTVGLGSLGRLEKTLNNTELRNIKVQETMRTERHNISTYDIIFSRAFRVLENFCNAAGQVQEAGFCCDCFTILVITSTDNESEIVELRRIELELALRLRAELYSMLSPGQRHDSRLTRSWDISMDILCKVTTQASRTHSIPAVASLPSVRNVDEVLNICCLAIQFLCLGFLSYIQAHTGAIQPFFLDTAQKKFILQGIGEPGKAYPQVAAHLLNLSCMGDMINESVLVFSLYTGVAMSLPKGRPRLDLFASPEDLMDTWGPGQFMRSTSRVDDTGIYAVNIGGGVIAAVDEDSRKFHWSPASQPCGSFAKTFDPCTKILIGSGIKTNVACLADENQRWLNSGELLENLGTFQGHWEAAQRQAGIQAGQYFNVSYLETWAKTPTATLKQIQLGHPDNHLLPFLESYWGLQVSFCTGIARRVPLRELLADIMPAFVESLIPIPELWDNLLNKYKILNAFYAENLQEWLGELTHDCQKQVAVIIRSILSVLQHTGVDKKGEKFVIAWIRKKKPFQCFKIGCEKESYWARILADSTDCATFAYVTSKCLETDGYKCRGPTAIWHNQSALLGTSVCRHKPNGPSNQDPGTTLPTWTLKHAEKYFMGKPESLERVQVDIQIQGAEPRLHVLPSTIPRVVRLRLDTNILRRLCRLREKQALDALAENVVVLAGRPRQLSMS